MTRDLPVLPAVLAIAAAALATPGCGATMEPKSVLTAPRILAIRADPPELRVQASTDPMALATAERVRVRLTPLLHPTGDEAPALRWDWCPALGQVDGRLVCAGDELKPLSRVEVGQDEAGPYVDVPAVFPDVAAAFEAMLAERPDACPPPCQAPDLAAGVPLYVWLTAEPAAGVDMPVQEAFKRIVVVDADRPTNTNPVLADLTANGLPLTAGDVLDAGEEVRLTATVDGDSLDVVPDGAGDSQVEDPFVSWVSTVGSLADSLTFGDRLRNTLTLPVSGGAGRIVVVLRDGRGGVDWIDRPIRVSESVR